MPKTLRIRDFSVTVRLGKAPDRWYDSKTTNGQIEVVVDSNLDKLDQIAALFAAVSRYMRDPADWAMFIQNNVFDVDWMNAIVTTKKKSKGATSTVLADLGDDVKMIKRLGH